jgi:hypothetical protein
MTARYDGEVVNAIGDTLPPESLQTVFLPFIASDDQLSAFTVLYPPGLTVPVKHPLSRHAQPGLQTVPGIIETSVDDLRIAGRGFLANTMVPFQHQNLPAIQCQLPGYRQANDTCANYEGINSIWHIEDAR